MTPQKLFPYHFFDVLFINSHLSNPSIEELAMHGSCMAESRFLNFIIRSFKCKVLIHSGFVTFLLFFRFSFMKTTFVLSSSRKILKSKWLNLNCLKFSQKTRRASENFVWRTLKRTSSWKHSVGRLKHIEVYI